MNHLIRRSLVTVWRRLNSIGQQNVGFSRSLLSLLKASFTFLRTSVRADSRVPYAQPSQPAVHFGARHFRSLVRCLAIFRSSLFSQRPKLETSAVGGAWLTRKIDSLASFSENFAGSPSLCLYASSLFTMRSGEATGGRDKERGRSKPLSRTESSERRKKKLKANNGVNDDAECRGGSGSKSNKKACRILFLSYPGNLAPSTVVMKLRFASALFLRVP